ncbi:MAG: hypothetical protein V1740_05655 [Candidatus Woesearchaeota archaeon]
MAVETHYALGLDFGTESARAVVVDINTGETMGVAQVESGFQGVRDITFNPNSIILHDKGSAPDVEVPVRWRWLSDGSLDSLLDND